MPRITRRTFLKGALVATSASLLSRVRSSSSALRQADGQPTPTRDEAARIDRIVTQTMRDHQVPGLSLAVSRHGQMVYQKGFGLADQATGEPVTIDSVFRIASLSKPITSVALFSLIEQGRLGLHERLLGEQGLLGLAFGDCSPRVQEITLHHLLTHTGGGWANDGADPMFLHPEMGHRALIAWTLRHQPLRHPPGTHYAYSNFGYCLLGRVIEKVTGQDYADAVRQRVLSRCGIHGMRLAGNTLAERGPKEVVYYEPGWSALAPYQMNVTRMDAHGGWTATAGHMVHFAMHVDGLGFTPSLLSADRITAMTTPSPVNPGYACGWAVNGIPNWWHTGTLPGSSAILVRTASGLCWAALSNTRNVGLNLDGLMWQVVKAVPAWHA